MKTGKAPLVGGLALAALVAASNVAYAAVEAAGFRIPTAVAPRASSRLEVADMGMGELGPELGGEQDDMILNDPGKLPREPDMIVNDPGKLPPEPDMVLNDPGRLPPEPDMDVSDPGHVPAEAQMDIEQPQDLDADDDID